MKNQNLNCDGSGPHSKNPEVRILLIGRAGNAILCFTCYCREIAFRLKRNEELSRENKFQIPAWKGLKVYRLN